MAEGMRRLRAAGAIEAVIVNGMDNLAAAALYQALGFVQLGQVERWTLTLA